MEELDLIFNKIRNENPDYDERINNGDIYYIHSIVLDRNLTPNEMLYIMAYYSNYKNIQKADEFFKKTVSKTTLNNIKKHLVKLGYINIKVQNPEEIKKQTIELSHKGNKCEWCGNNSYVLQEHHFPISAKNGGDKVVKICPNCHYTFHKLESEIYE